MKRIIITILVLGTLAGAVFGLRAVHQTQNSWVLDAYLALFIILPLVIGMFNLSTGRQGIKALFQILFVLAGSLLVMTLVYQFVSSKWEWAALGGVTASVVLNLVRQWQVSMAQSKLTQANVLLRNGNFRDGLSLSHDARAVFLAKGNKPGLALAELLLGVGYEGTGEPIRAARYYQSSLASFEHVANSEENIKTAKQGLARLRQKGIDVSGGPVEAVDATLGVAVDWMFLADGVLAITALIGVLHLWKIALFEATLPVLIAAGIFLLLLFYGNYAVSSLASAFRPGVRPVLGYVFYTLSLLGMTASLAIILSNADLYVAADIPEVLRPSLLALLHFSGTQPDWFAPAALALSLLVMASVVISASGRSPVGLLATLGGSDTRRQALRMAADYLVTREWEQVIVQLTRIDLINERDESIHNTILFYLALSHHMADHPAESSKYLRELLDSAPSHQEGLYLAGYIALKDDRLEEAEAAWQELYSLAPGFKPTGSRTGERDARYYLALTFYRRAMAILDENYDAAMALLEDVGKLKVIDQQVADALARVHLSQAASYMRQHRLEQAQQDVELAQQKLEHMEQLVHDPKEAAKLRGLVHAASGLLLFMQDRYHDAISELMAADQETEHIARKGMLLDPNGENLLAQLLRALHGMEEDGDDKIDPAFSADLGLLAGLSHLRELHEKIAHSGASHSDWQSVIQRVTDYLEKGIASNPDSVESRAILGLLYYYFDPDQRATGIELLQTVRERVSSRLITQAITGFEAERKRRDDSRKAYFETLQEYLRFANIPLEERMAMREHVLEQMRMMGEYDKFVEQGSLEIDADREREPTVQEYMTRAAILRDKLEQLFQGNQPDVSDEVRTLVEQLGKHNEALREQVRRIAEVEHQLLIKAQGLL